MDRHFLPEHGHAYYKLSHRHGGGGGEKQGQVVTMAAVVANPQVGKVQHGKLHPYGSSIAHAYPSVSIHNSDKSNKEHLIHIEAS